MIQPLQHQALQTAPELFQIPRPLQALTQTAIHCMVQVEAAALETELGLTATKEAPGLQPCAGAC